MPYDDDDYVDYENEDYDDSEFVEDNLNDEDYALLYETLPVLKDQLGDYNSDIQDEDLKAVLYYNYFEVDNALAEIRSKFKRKRGKFDSVFSRLFDFSFDSPGICVD
ncbi:unnamed protein product [Kuraishia capsulata CBS 1993]|uniref:HBS1-like protein N-terminal domain-containing protein n=1 Tax=Kuraishia capsulata CBS 1993 TaxID=1382522 RepID=W6MNJ1_9ASCO|nr:uncharacterized protein KUCA_T00004173001 [Kuraishia capsulata CBS 1993]CDK28191.1 unnamed protein product [Kuraishia capsulata CBS 1993]